MPVNKPVIKSMSGGYKITPTTTKPSMKLTSQKGGSSMKVHEQKGGSSMKVHEQKGGSSCAKPLSGGSKKSKKDAKKTKKAKKSKKPMPKGFAYCLLCSKQTEMLNPETRTTKNGRKQMVGEGKCGHKVYRFI